MANVRKIKKARSADADWPEFAEWLQLALTLDTTPEDRYKPAEDRLYLLEDMMEANAFDASWLLSERQLAMWAAVYIWHERDGKPFDMRTTLFNGPNLTCLMSVLAVRAAATLPEVPFKLRNGG